MDIRHLAFVSFFFREYSIFWALGLAYATIDTSIWTDDEQIPCFSKRINWAYIHAVRVLTVDTLFSYHIRHVHLPFILATTNLMGQVLHLLIETARSPQPIYSVYICVSAYSMNDILSARTSLH